MVLSFNTFSLAEAPTAELLRRVAEVGFSAVGLFSRHASDVALGRADLVGLKPTGLFVHFADAPKTSLTQAVESCHAAGENFNAPLTLIPSAQFRDVEEISDFVAELLARSPGGRVLLEPLAPNLAHVSRLNRLEDALAVVRRVRKSIGIVVDFAHVSALEILELTAADIAAVELVHLCDMAVGEVDTDQRVLPGEGSLPLSRLVAHLVQGGYQGAWEFEVIGTRMAAPNVLEDALESCRRLVGGEVR